MNSILLDRPGSPGPAGLPSPAAFPGPAGLTGPADPPQPPGLAGPASFLAAYPGYQSTSLLDRLRASQYSYLDEGGQVYLDYGGAGLPAEAQLTAHAERIRGGCYGNPHSANPASAASTELIERTRLAVLAHFNASPEEYAAIFTPNATGACRLVGEAYPFGPRSRLILTADNHNSVNGIREFARSRGARIQYVPFCSPELRVDDRAIREELARPGPLDRGLFGYPAQSNFSGVRHPLSWIETAHDLGYDVLLDAAAYVPSNRLDLSAVKPDFVAVSWYKVFGYPTGVGCLIGRRLSACVVRGSRADRSRSRACGPTGTGRLPTRPGSRTARPASCRYPTWRSGCPGSTTSGST